MAIRDARQQEQKPEDVLLTTRQVAQRWQLSESRLMNQRSAQTGCRYVKIGNTVRYRLSDVLKYEKSV